jgi:CDP-glycerol glycerophosphotransferase
MARRKIWLNIKQLFAFIAAKIVGFDTNKTTFISMFGNSYGCNPKAISDYIKSHNSNWKVVWAFNDSSFDNYSKFEKRAYKIGTYRYYYNLFTSKFIISNARLLPMMLPHKLKEQVYLQTWHGTALKRIEADVEDSLDLEYVDSSKRDSKYIDYILSESTYMTNIYRNSFWYDGKIKELGSARTDIFFNRLSISKQKVYKALNLSEDTKLLLYAPTFRNGISLEDHFKLYDIDFSRLITAVQKKIPGNWRLVIRFHPNLVTDESVAQISENYPGSVNATTYPDMQELLAATDILVTDYSSSIFDFMYTYRPCFMYTKDKESYDRGFYMPIKSLPFCEIGSNSEIERVIDAFDNDEYKCNVTAFMAEMGCHTDGLSCNKIYKFMVNYSKEHK